jgi:hypothetical protein
MTKWFGTEVNPVLLVLHRYNKLNEWSIIRSVADWFNTIGKDEFDKALAEGLIKTCDDDPRLYELSDTAEKMICEISEKWMNDVKSKIGGLE